MADYPTGVYNPRTKANKTGVVYTPAKTTVSYAEDVSLLDAEVVAIETELGASPKGSHDSVKDRFDDDETSMATKTGTETLTNKRITKRVDSQTTTDTITPEISTYDIFIRTAQAHALVINNHSTSTPVDGDMILFEILSDATPRAITYGDKYVAKAGTALPSTTVASKNLTMLFIWRNDLSKWNLLASGQEA
jgi:galactitol-specific phosphotransferase system IIB component